jgi:hypothetical protein
VLILRKLAASSERPSRLSKRGVQNKRESTRRHRRSMQSKTCRCMKRKELSLILLHEGIREMLQQLEKRDYRAGRHWARQSAHGRAGTADS